MRTRTGKERWDRSVIWGMLRNPAYCGKAVFGKTRVTHEAAGLNRTARLAGRTVPRQVRAAPTTTATSPALMSSARRWPASPAPSRQASNAL